MHQLREQRREIVLGTANIIISGKHGIEHSVRALCDNGSQVNLITQTTVLQLNEKPTIEKTTLLGVGGTSLGSSLGEVTLKIKLKTGSSITSKFLIVKNITNYCPSTADHGWQQLKGNLADERYNKQGKIHALLGVGIWIQVIESGVIKSSDNTAVTHQTKLGYVILENRDNPYQVENPYIGSVRLGPSIKNLMSIVQKLWEVEELPHAKKRTREEELCEEVFVKQHQRDAFGRYIVRMPFNEHISKLGKSKKMALRQFFAMENRMKRNKEFGEKYKIFMSEYETLGHMTRIWEKEENGYYTPHHGVLSASKFRVVFNASAKTTSGISLNETQLIGEKLQQDLFAILINFRQSKVGIIADIEKMYRQVLMHSEDRKYQKILWRADEREPVQTYQLNTVTYGQACAPHCAIRALVQCAADNEEQYARGARLVRECFYVDDLLTGANNFDEANKIKNELTNLLRKGGFKITKWKTNGKLNEHIEFKETDEPSVLGLCWNLSTDKFFYKIKDTENKETIWTKRKILSKIGKMYDPNGYVGPVIMKGKIIIQDLWRDKMEWDEEVKGDIKTKWQNFNEDLKNIHLISINRWFGTMGEAKMQLHGFCDASEKGYGAVIYSRVRDGEKFKTEIIVSKSRVAPLKNTTIPRLELCAADLLAKLMKSIFQIFRGDQRNIQTICWSDSQIVLHWLKKPSNSLKTYVANRVANVQEISDELNIKWNWIMGEDNPADLISRGTSILELHHENKWWQGPEWLYNISLSWPEQPSFPSLEQLKQNKINEITREIRAVHLAVQLDHNELTRGKWYKHKNDNHKIFKVLDSYGELSKLIRVTAYIKRAVFNFRFPKIKQLGNIDDAEERAALDYLIRMDQQRMFPKELEIAKGSRRVRFKNLVIIWDSANGFLRVDGRIRSDNLTKDEQFPILLDRDGALAALIIRDAHLNETGHGGTQLVLQYIRKRYWIIGARLFVKTIIRKCPTCFRLRMTESEQLMATLPNFRTTPGRAFSTVGIDYAGPIWVRFNLGRAPRLTKAWIAVFVCVVTRAIHLELVSDATTQAFVAALRRMIARRGQILQIISDNGTNFVGANNYLTMISSQISTDATNIERQCKIKWRFTTPRAPHQGGIYEAAVKSVKHHLTRIIGETTLTFEEYSTVLCQVEALVNSRPLCALNDDPTSLNALTPGHFLIGEALVRIPDEQDFRDEPVNRLSRWNHLQKMVQHFWDRWHDEYVSTLINRKKWLVEKRNFREGDLVIIKEDNLPPMRWKLGRIEQTLPGSVDQLVRSVIIRTATGLLKRPITKIGLLVETTEE